MAKKGTIILFRSLKCPSYLKWLIFYLFIQDVHTTIIDTSYNIREDDKMIWRLTGKGNFTLDSLY